MSLFVRLNGSNFNTSEAKTFLLKKADYLRMVEHLSYHKCVFKRVLSVRLHYNSKKNTLFINKYSYAESETRNLQFSAKTLWQRLSTGGTIMSNAGLVQSWSRTNLAHLNRYAVSNDCQTSELFLGFICNCLSDFITARITFNLYTAKLFFAAFHLLIAHCRRKKRGT